jgi:hypothetical protein
MDCYLLSVFDVVKSGFFRSLRGLMLAAATAVAFAILFIEGRNKKK